MDPEVLNDLYQRATSLGYKKSKEEFTSLLYSDKAVFDDNYSYVKSKGYKKSADEFGVLIGKKKSDVVQTPKNQTPSGPGSVQTQPTSGSKPARFIGVGDQVSNADKDAILKFAQQQQGTTPKKELSSEEIRAKINQSQYEEAAKRVRDQPTNVLKQAPTVEKGPVLMSEDDPRYQERVEEQRKIEEAFEKEKQSVISYLRYSPKDILLDEDALNEDIEYLKKEKGFSDKAIMEGVEEAKKQRLKRKSDQILNGMYSSTMSQLYSDVDENISDEQKKRITEGAVFSKAIQTGVENMTEDERSAYVLLGELKKVNEQLISNPGDNALIVKSAELKTKIGNLLDNPKMLFDPVTGEMVDKSNENAQRYDSEVNAEASKMKSQTTEDKLAKNYLEKWAAFKYWDGLYDKNQRNLTKVATLSQSPNDWNNKILRDAQTLKANWIKAKKEFDVATRSYMLNRDPSGVKRDYGIKAAGEVLLESVTPGIVQDVLPEGMLPLTDKTYLDIVQGQLPEAGIELTPEMKQRFEKTLTEEIVEGAGGLVGILPKLWIAGRIVQTGTFLTGIDNAIRVLSNGNRFEKFIAFSMRAGAEETKTQIAGFAPGVGVGFQAAGETIRLPRLTGKFGVIMQPALDAAVAGSIGGTVGTEVGEVIAKTVDALNSNQEWMAKMEELFPDFDTVERRIVTNLVLNGLFGLTHIPKGSLTFSPEKLTEMAYKLKDKGMKQEADYLLKRAAELGGYKKIDLQIARGATGVAGRRGEQEQRPVVKPAAPVVQPPAPEVKAEEVKAEEVTPEVKAPAPEVKPAVTKPVVEAKPKEISPITIEESINSQKVYDREGEKGVIKKEGQIVVLEKANGDVIELGNIDQVKDKSISDFNIKETVDIILNDDNTFDVDGKKYVNNYSTPESAISVDKDGNYSVTLDTPDGKKRTFRGERGEEMAYQIKLKQLENERNEQTIDRAIKLTDEALAAETKPGEVAPKEEVRVTREVEPTKPIEDAVQIETTGEVPVQPEARVGEQVAKGKPEAEPQKVAQEGRPQEVEGAAATTDAIDARRERYSGRPANRMVKLQKDSENRDLTKEEIEEVEAYIESAKQSGYDADRLFRELNSLGYVYAFGNSREAFKNYLEDRLSGETNIKVTSDYNFNKQTESELAAQGAAPAKAKEPAPKKKTGGKKEPVVETKAEEPPAAETKPLKPTGTTKETVDIETLKEEVDKNGRPLSEFKDGDVVILAFKANDAWDLYTEGTISRKDGEVRLIRFKENPVSKRFKFTYLSENTKVIPKPEGDPIYIGPEDFKIEKPSPKGEKPATEGEFWTNEKAFSVQPKVGDIVDFDGKKHEVLQKTKVGKEQKYLLKEQPKAEEPVPAPKEEAPADAATFLKEKLGLKTKPGEKAEEPAPAAKEEKPVAKEEVKKQDIVISKTKDSINDTPILKSAASNFEVLYIPKKVYELAYENDVINKSRTGTPQPLDRIIQRGGYSIEELNKLLPNWKEIANAERINKSKPTETRTTEEKIAEAQKTVDDAAKWLKDKLKINTLPPDAKTMGTTADGLIDLAADAVKQLVATGIKTADAVKQVIDALREGGYLKDINERDFTAKVSGVEQPKPTGKIEWKPVVQDNKIAKRNPVVTEAARRLMKGEITNQQYRDIVEQNSPIGPITNFIEPATEQQVKAALSSEKVKNANKSIKQGEKVGLRLDIPAFERNNTWVVSVHEGHSKKSPVLSYTSVAKINNVSFGAAPNETIKMAAGSYKDAVSKIYGEWSELPGKTLAEKAENAKALVEEIANDPNWVQVGLNPFRHSYFYDRSREKGRPLISADEVIQIGGLVYAKNPVYGKWTDAAYRVKGLLDAAGKEVRFSKRTGEPEGAKPVDVKEKEIIDEMNSMELVNKGVSIEAKSTTDKKINTEELNSSLDTPLEVVDFKNYEGIPFIFTISDQLRTGDTVNPFTGEVISDLKGGLGFNGTKGNENAAWANTTAAEGNATVERAMYVYNKNKALFDRLWKEGRLPDGHIPMAVVKMGETSILSNEAVFRVGIQNIQTLPMSNRNKATVVLKQTLKGKIAETKKLIAKGADPKTGEKYSENTMNSKKKQLAQYENILDILNQNKYKDIVDVLKDNKNFSLPEKAIIINQVFYGVPTTIGGKPIDINRSKAKTPVSKALIGNKNPELINIGRITDLLTEPSMKEIPSMHIISIVAVDVKNPGLVKTTHPNYEFGPRGKSIGVLEQPIHMKDAFGEAYGSVVSKVAKNEANDKSITPTQALQQGIPVQSGLPNKVYQAAVAKGRLDAVDKLAGFVRQVFPKTTFFTSKEAWETIMADPSVKKQMKDGDVVYGITADGQVYLNPNLKNTKVLLHESGHIWEDFVKENNPKLWEKGESLVSNTKELAEAQKVYGDTPRARSEAIMEIMSTKGDTIVNAAQKADFKEWMVGLWKYISDKFSSLLGLSPKEIENLTLDKFVEGMLADILSGKELKAGKHVADTKPSKAEMAENARFSKEGTTPTTTERQIAEAERTIDNAAAWLKEKLKVTTLPEGTQKMGMSQEDLIDLVALAAKKLVSKGAKVSQAIKQVLDSLREGGFLTNMDEKAITSGSRRRMSPSYETDMYKIHERLVDMAKDYIANGGTSRKEFAYQVGVKEKNVEQAWEEANGVRTFNKDQIDRRLADITRTAIMRGFNVRTRLDELLQTNRDIRSAINNFMRSKELYAVVNPVQAKALARRAANVRTMEQLDKFIEYADKVINDANYAQDMADIRKMQDAAKRVKHTGNTKAVKEFASINPESIPENRRDEYIQALDELAGRVPNYATMQRIYFDIVGAPKKARDFSNITTFNKAADIFNSIMSNKIESVEDYRKLFSDINGLKRRLNQLVENDTITMDEFDTIMDQIGTTTAEVKQKFASGISKLKNDLITDIRSKTLDYRPQNKEEQRMIDSFKEQNNDDLRRMEPEDLWELNELIDRANDGNFDYYRWNGVLAEAEKIRRGELVGKQLQGAKMLNTTTAARKLAKQESTFIEGVLGLGRSQAGAVSKYVVSEVERAAGNYSLGIKDGLNELMKAKGNLDKKSMHKIGMVVTYLQEYMAQFNPSNKNTPDIGTRDWFGQMLSDAKMKNDYASISVNLGTLRNQSKEQIIRDLYDSMPKDANGNVSPKAVYESIMAKDGRFLSKKEQEMLDAVMEFIDKEVKPKQESANFSRGLPFEELSFYMPRINLNKRGDIEAKVETSRNRVRIQSGYGKERTDHSIRPIEVDFESAITSAIEAANRDYYFGKALDMVSGTLGYAAKQGDIAKNTAEILSTNINDMMQFEFARKQSDLTATLSGLALSARAAQTLLNPIRTVLVELPATFLQVPLRSKNVSGYVDIINPTNGKLFQDLLEYSESPLRLRENISRAIDIDQGAIKPQSLKDKALVFLAGAPERITMIGSWMPTFKNEFFKLTGEKFDSNKFSSDPNYRKKFNRAIKEAATSADMTTQKIIGVTTKLSQARELELPFESKLFEKGVSKDEILGKTLGFFGNYPRREYIEFMNGFKEIGERYRAGEGAASLTSISKPLSVAIGTFTYGYMASLVYTLTKAYFGTEDEKEKAQEELERLGNTQGIVEEAITQSVALAGSKYYAVGRMLTSGATLIAYNYADDPETKKMIARMYKNTYYADPIDPDGSKTFLSKDNKEKMALHITRFIPQFSIAIDKYQQGLEAYGGIEKLMDRYDEVGFSGLADEERDLWLLGDIILKTGGIIANLYGTAIPMEKTLQMYVRGQYEAVPLSKDDVREEMQRRRDLRNKTPEERKETFEERIKRKKREMELRKQSREYGIPYVKPR